MPRSRRLVLSLALVSVLWGAVSTAASGELAHEALADAMVRMMQAMGLIGSGFADSTRTDGMPLTMPGWPSGFSAWSDLNLSGKRREGQRESFQPWGVQTFLEGVWESNDGGLLIVQGGNYRLYASCKGSLDGSIRLGSDWIELTNPHEHFSQRFEFAHDRGRLALRDQQGQIFVYRRLVLDGGLGLGN